MFAHLVLGAFIPTIVTDSAYLVEQASEKIANPSTSFGISVRVRVREATAINISTSFFHARRQRVQYRPRLFPFTPELQNV